MKIRIAGTVFFILAVSTFGRSTAFSQCEPNPLLWGGGAVSPVTGELIVPALCYDPSTGVLAMELRGLNGLADTTAGDPTVLGDDVPFTSALINTPVPTAILLDGNVGGFNVMSQYFNGALQFTGMAGSSPFLLPDQYPLAAFPTGLPPGALGTAEFAIHFGPQVPGALLVGSVQYVPEPAVAGMIAAGIVLGAFRRRVR